MTVAVSCNLSDGVILGVDSAVSLPAPGGVAKIYENAEKLFQLGDKPIGIAVFGLATFGARSIGGFIREFEVADPNGVVTTNEVNVSDVVEELRSFFMGIYQNHIVPALESDTKKKYNEIPKDQLPVVGFVVGGFSYGAYLSEVWEILIPHHDKPGSASQKRQKGEFGTNWFATFGPIRRYILGFESDLINELVGYFEKIQGKPYKQEEIDEINNIVRKYEYQIPYGAMPIQEGIDHVRFLVELVINHHRYVIGAPIVGGDARLGMVTYRGEKFRILE